MANQNKSSRGPVVFGDTASWIALLNEDDQLHSKALEVRRELRQRKVRVVTSELVLLEVADGLSSPPIRAATIGFIEALRQEPTLDIVPVSEDLLNETEEEEWAGWQALSYRSLWELWDNEQDAIYDTL